MGSNQIIAAADVEFCDRHDATVQFRNGRVYIEVRGARGLRTQYNGWTFGEAINLARKALDARGEP